MGNGLKTNLSVKPEVPVGVAFVTFPKGSIIDDRIRADFAYTPLIMPRNKSSIGSKMDIRWWATNNAPYPNDILWKNLSRKGAQLKFHSLLDQNTDQNVHVGGHTVCGIHSLI